MSAKTAAQTEALAERDRLLDLLLDLDERGVALNARYRAAETAVGLAEQAAADARVASFLGESGGDDDVEGALKAREAAREAIGSATEEIDAWRKAIDQTERRLVNLAFRHRDDWERELADKAAAADAALAALAEPIAEARRAWGDAAVAYRGLERWLLHGRARVLQDQEEPHRVPDFPLDVRRVIAGPST